MRPYRALIALALLLASGSAYGQKHGAQPHGVPAQHTHQGQPAGHGQHMMSPGMQQHFMMQQFYYGMMMEQMYYENQRRARQALQVQGAAAKPQSRAKRRPQSPVQESFGGNVLSEMNPSGATHAQPPQSQSPGRRQGDRATQPPSQSASQLGSLQNSQQSQQNEAKAKLAKHHDAANQEERKRDVKPGHRERLARSAALGTWPDAVDRFAVDHLRNAHKELREANHDYDGHRVKAMRHIENAMRELGSPAEAAMDALVASSLGQARSDHALHAARHSSHLAETSLRTRTHRFDHHQRAEVSIAEAIREIDRALEVR